MNFAPHSELKQQPDGLCASRRHKVLALAFAAGLQLMQLSRVSGEDHVDYRYEAYREDGRRINVDTHSLLFEVAPRKWLTIRGETVFDAISGASPTGSPPPNKLNFIPPNLGGPTGPFSSSVPVKEMHEKRYAGDLEPTFSLGRQRLTPQFSYSGEHDYISRGFALNYALDFNDKNTTMNLAWSADWDKVLPGGFLHSQMPKNSDDFLIGVNQLLGPKTVATANFTYGNARGYLNDQYKGVHFENDPPQGDPTDPSVSAERRPMHRDHYTAYGSLTQYVTPLNASVEGSYRFFHDSYGVYAHSIGLAWYQKLGSIVTVSPSIRYHRQTAADFYATEFPDFAHPPRFYSADYRLSELETITGGLTVTVKARDWLWFDVGYKRYVMSGLDKVTSASAYPSANIFSIGARVWF